MAFHSVASNLVPGDTNGVEDVFVAGPAMLLVFVPEIVVELQPLEIFIPGGDPWTPVFLFVSDVNGTPFLQKLLRGTFDAAGRFTLRTTTPPGVAGLSITHFAMGLNVRGRVNVTAPAVLTVQ